MSCSFVPNFNFEKCCHAHDEFYSNGGDEYYRKYVDICFKMCIKEKGHPIIAQIYYFGVRLFGWMRFNYTKKT